MERFKNLIYFFFTLITYTYHQNYNLITLFVNKVIRLRKQWRFLMLLRLKTQKKVLCE